MNMQHQQERGWHRKHNRAAKKINTFRSRLREKKYQDLSKKQRREEQAIEKTHAQLLS